MGDVAYKLILPATSLIHPVIHVSQLKKSVPKEQPVEAALPDDPPDLQLPEQIISRRWRSLGNSSISEGLVSWSGMPDSLATWENLQELRRRFPEAPAWGQAGFQEEGDVTNPLPKTSRRQRRRLEDEHLQYCPVPEAQAIRRSRWERRQNERFNRPDWTT